MYVSRVKDLKTKFMGEEYGNILHAYIVSYIMKYIYIYVYIYKNI